MASYLKIAVLVSLLLHRKVFHMLHRNTANDINRSRKATPLREAHEFHRQCLLLQERILAQRLSPVPGGRYVVFLSFTDGTKRADVVHGTGSDLKAAFEDAIRQALHVHRLLLHPALWIKADVVTECVPATAAQLGYMIRESGYHEFFRYSISLDANLEQAFLEEELNGAKILDYKNGCLSLEDLNRYLTKAKRQTVQQLPEQYVLFSTQGWLLERSDSPFPAESGSPDSRQSTGQTSGTDSGRYHILPLYPEDPERGRRRYNTLPPSVIRPILELATDWLSRQVQPDGSFHYGYYPRFDNDIASYNCMRHASTIWSLLCQYRLSGRKDILELAHRTIQYLLQNAVVWQNEETAYLSEPTAGEIKLGGNGVLILAMTEYMEAIECKDAPAHASVDEYVRICRALGEGILALQDAGTGEFYHVLHAADFSRKERCRTVYYDGEATYALCRLYRLTGEKRWLQAAMLSADHFIAADYTQHQDHWVAYAMKELTWVVRRDDYDAFALQNAQRNLDFLYHRETTYHTFLELLMVTFEAYEHIQAVNPALPYLQEFDLPYFLSTIRVRADRMLNGFFFPEYAMYMRAPQKILGSFMVRHDGFRVRIDDVQHNIGGFYLYCRHYEQLVKLGMQP